MKLLFLSALLTLPLSAFEFDIWKSGSSMDNIVITAQEKNLPLCRNLLEPKSKGYDFECLKGMEDHKILVLHSSLLGEMSRQEFHFTEDTRKLYKIVIKWSHKTDMEKIILPILEKKYKRAQIYEDDPIYGISQAWPVDKHTLITEKSGVRGTILEYLDPVLEKQYVKKKIKKEESKIANSVAKDGYKF